MNIKLHYRRLSLRSPVATVSTAIKLVRTLCELVGSKDCGLACVVLSDKANNIV
jgi:hypothetical protein